MALIFKQKITTNTLEIYALYEAVGHHLFKPLLSDKKLSAAEYLAVDYLRKLASRLYTKYRNEIQNNRSRQFEFTFSPQEVLAITLCIRNYKQDLVLDVILGKVQQRSLNLENYIELNHKYLKQ